MLDLKTIFDGWGTFLIGFLVTLLIGGGVIHAVRKLSVKQNQRAGKRSSQKQRLLLLFTLIYRYLRDGYRLDVYCNIRN